MRKYIEFIFKLESLEVFGISYFELDIFSC